MANKSQYDHQRNYFDAIDTEPKAYILGFVAADGCIHDNRLIISLAAKDTDHVKRVRDAMGSNHPVHISPNNTQYGNHTKATLGI